MTAPLIELMDGRHREIGAVINRLRGVHAYTTPQLADVMGIKVRTLEDKLQNRKRFTVGELFYLANLFGLSLDELLQDPANL